MRSEELSGLLDSPVCSIDILEVNLAHCAVDEFYGCSLVSFEIACWLHLRFLLLRSNRGGSRVVVVRSFGGGQRDA